MNNPYPIDRIIVMSLERTPERYERWIGASAIMEIPNDIISVAFGKDNLNFNNNMRRVAESAAADGFPFVIEYTQTPVHNGIQQTAATVCQIWNYARILRQIVEDNETALIIFDDKMITIDFHEFCNMFSEVQSVRNETFYALQLKLRGSLKDIKLPEIDIDKRIKISSQVFSGVFGKGQGQYIDVFLQKGISGYDESIVFSPEGAAWFLKCLDNAPAFYRYLDHFICDAMPEFAKQAILRHRGVYCPSEIAYKFVDEFMPMGTTTDYANKDSKVYEKSREKTELNYYWGNPSAIKTEISADLEKKLQQILES